MSLDEPLSEPKALEQRADARRAQILAAAADCFREYGFHGASIAMISRTCGMSPGHIYHYFANKEAIIEAIVAQDLERLLALHRELRSVSDPHGAFLQQAAEGVQGKLDAKFAGLQLEIMAEAARNPGVADIVTAADRNCRAGLAETLRNIRRAAGFVDRETTIAGMVEVLAAMFEGLQFRAIRNPEIDKDVVIYMFRRVIQCLLSQPASEAAPLLDAKSVPHQE